MHLLETLRGGGVFFGIKILTSLGAYGLAWYVSREYGADGNGVLAFALTAATLLAALFNLGLNTYIVKIIQVLKARGEWTGTDWFYRRALVTIVGATLGGCGVLMLISMVVSDEALSRDMYLVGWVTIPISIMLFISHAYKAHQRILGFSLLQTNVVQVLALFILLVPIWGKSSVSEPVWAVILAGSFLCIAGWHQYQSSKGNLSAQEFRFRPHIRQALPMLAGGLAFMILNLTDRMMLRFMDTTTQLGIYDVSLRLSNLALLGILSLNTVAEPKFAHFYARNEKHQLKQFAARMTWIGIGTSLPVLCVLGLFPATWLGVFGTGDEFLSGIPSLYLLLVGQVISVGCGAVLIMLNMTGHQRDVQMILITCTILNIGLNFILIPSMSIDGAALATMISTLVWNLWGLWVIRKKLGFWMWGGGFGQLIRGSWR